MGIKCFIDSGEKSVMTNLWGVGEITGLERITAFLLNISREQLLPGFVVREFLDPCGQRPLSYSRRAHGDTRLFLGVSEWIIEKEKY